MSETKAEHKGLSDVSELTHEQHKHLKCESELNELLRDPDMTTYNPRRVRYINNVYLESS